MHHNSPMPNASRLTRVQKRAIPRPHSQRGMAVLLALIAVSLAIVIGLALASGRDATTATSTSIVRVASARTAAAGSLDIATRILEQNTNIAAGDGADGMRMVCMPVQIGGATISARMTDMLTGMSPTSNSLAVAIVASATIDEVTQQTRAAGRVPWASNVARADLDLSEFALAARQGLAIRNDSVVTVWKNAPLAALGEPVVIGTASREIIDADSFAVMHGVSLATPGDFPETREEADEQLAEGEFAIPADLHMPAAPFPPMPMTSMEISPDDLPTLVTALEADEIDGGVIPALPEGSAPDDPSETGPAENSLLGAELGLEPESIPDVKVIGMGGELTPPPAERPADLSLDIIVTQSLELASLNLRVTGTIVEGGWRSMHVLGDLTITDTTLDVEVPLVIAVYGDLLIDSESRISLSDDCKLTFHVLGNTTITDSSYIGPDDVAFPASTQGTLTYSPQRATIYAMPQSKVTIGDASVVVGEIYGPDAAIAVRNLAAVYGRAAGIEIELDAGRIFYDPALDSARGYRNPISGLWGKPNVLREEVKDVAVLDDISLATFTEATGIVAEAPSPILANAHVNSTGGVDDVQVTNVVKSTVDASVAMALAASISTSTALGTGDPSYAGAGGELPAAYVLYGTLRDFRSASDDDVGSGFPGMNSSLEPGKLFKMVHEELDGELKPVLHDPIRNAVDEDFRTFDGLPIAWNMYDSAAGDISGSEGPEMTKSLTPSSRFKDWFRDIDGENLSEATKIAFELAADGNGKPVYIFDSDLLPTGGYYPADGRLFGNPPDKATKKPAPHNYHFTVEFQARLTYDASTPQWMGFASIDDLWVFVDGKLAVDLSGFGEKREQYLLVNRLAQREGWAHGSAHDIRIFMANRSVDASYLRIMSNFPLETNGSDSVVTKPTAHADALKHGQKAIEASEVAAVFVTPPKQVHHGFKRR